jgi:hypothetical protein
MSRASGHTAIEIVYAERPFSNFDFVDQRFQGSFPIRRLFSQARSVGVKTLVLESVPAEGIVADENQEIRTLFADHTMEGLVRLSFWKKRFTTEQEIGELHSEDCLGYALLKLDRTPSGKVFRWHVFESIFSASRHDHNFLTCPIEVSFVVGGYPFQISGSLYCQQNGLNKACAQVALRSACAAYLQDPDLPYNRINQLAFAPAAPVNPGKGLSVLQIQNVLTGLGIPHFAIHYPSQVEKKKFRYRLPYEKLLYSGVESGAGALLAFSMGGPKAGSVGHIVPIIGHTFNEDTWAPNAEGDYFKIGKKIRYIASESWLSNFIAHDDNFGSNLCIPKKFVERKHANFVVALRPRGFEYPGFMAEFLASDYFYSLLPQLDTGANPWMHRMQFYVQGMKLILRTVAVRKADYVTHLAEAEDWEGFKEREEIVDVIKSILPETLWMVEVGIPDLFSTNKRKLGEILLDASRPYAGKKDYSFFVMARLPGTYAFFQKLDGHKHPCFDTVHCPILSHTEVMTKRPGNL